VNRPLRVFSTRPDSVADGARWFLPPRGEYLRRMVGQGAVLPHLVALQGITAQSPTQFARIVYGLTRMELTIAPSS
jgi:hypothetical protein